ncbi:MAG: hypothetical protein WCY19_06505 [Candidatus Gastranaerophilaceae bacterium]
MKKKILLLALALIIVSPCFAVTQSAKVSKNKENATPVTEQEMTLGVVQRQIRLGTSQDEVALALGSPNIVTRDSDGKDTWIYDKVASITSYSDSGFGVGAGGGVGGGGSNVGGGGILGVGYKKNQGQIQSVQKTLTVVIKFDKNYKVESFTYHMSKF